MHVLKRLRRAGTLRPTGFTLCQHFAPRGRWVMLVVTRMPRVALLFGLLAVLSAVFTNSSVASIPPQAVRAQSTDIIHRPTSRPYTGELSVFEDPKRDKKLQVNRVMDVLEIHTGSAVADIGAGSGWFTVRAARRVGSSGRIYAVEINPSYLDYIRDRAQKEKLPNIRIILGKSDDPLLPPNSVDAVLLMKTYHEVAQPIVLLRHVRAAMRSGARLGIIDRNGKGDDHGVNRDVVIDEVKRAGFMLSAVYDFVKPDGVDYFLIFGPTAAPGSGGPVQTALPSAMPSNPKGEMKQRFVGNAPGLLPKQTDRTSQIDGFARECVTLGSISIESALGLIPIKAENEPRPSKAWRIVSD